MPWELAGHMGPSCEQLQAGRWAELCRQLPAWASVGKDQAARPFSGAMACPTLVKETRLWDCCHQEQTSCVSPAVLYRPSSSCLELPRGAEHLQTRWNQGCSTLSSLTHVSAQQCPLLLLAKHREPGTALALTGQRLGSTSLGRGRLQSASGLLLACYWELAPSKVCFLPPASEGCCVRHPFSRAVRKAKHKTPTAWEQFPTWGCRDPQQLWACAILTMARVWEHGAPPLWDS